LSCVNLYVRPLKTKKKYRKENTHYHCYKQAQQGWTASTSFSFQTRQLLNSSRIDLLSILTLIKCPGYCTSIPQDKGQYLPQSNSSSLLGHSNFPSQRWDCAKQCSWSEPHQIWSEEHGPTVH